MSREKVLITGAAGFLARHLIEMLLESGRGVRAVIRPGGTMLAGALAGKVECVEADLTQSGVLDGLLSDVAVVYHLAGKYLPGDSSETLEELRRANVLTTRNLLESSIRAGVPRFIYVSSAAVCGRSREEVIREDNGAPDGAYGLSKWEAEELVRAVEPSRMNWTILRPTVVFGDNPAGLVMRLASAIRSGRFFLFGRGRNFVNLVHARDVAAMAGAVESVRVTSGKTYLLADQPVQFVELVEWIRQIVAPDKVVRRVPAVAGWVGAFACEFIGRLSGRKMPLSLQAVRFMTRSTVFSGERLRLETGIEPGMGVREGVRKLLLCPDASRIAAPN